MGRVLASLFLIIAISFASTFVFAAGKKVLLISDIDDTIKVSHVLSKMSAVSRAADITTPFTGMSQLYQLIVNENPDTTKVVYLSNAPAEIAGIPAIKFSHENFLKFNNFPTGEVDLKASIFEENHKIKEIRRLINEQMPDLVILVGDNGERDMEFYHQAVKDYASFSEIKMISFIHQLYDTKAPFYLPNYFAEIGKEIYPEQTGFVTPIEIALELQKQGELSQESVDWMIENVSPYIVAEDGLKWDGLKPLTFPSFAKCSNFVWKWEVTKKTRELFKKINDRCH